MEAEQGGTFAASCSHVRQDSNMGHSSWSVLPTVTVLPWQKGSVLEALMVTNNLVGLAWLSSHDGT